MNMPNQFYRVNNLWRDFADRSTTAPVSSQLPVFGAAIFINEAKVFNVNPIVLFLKLFQNFIGNFFLIKFPRTPLSPNNCNTHIITQLFCIHWYWKCSANSWFLLGKRIQPLLTLLTSMRLTIIVYTYTISMTIIIRVVGWKYFTWNFHFETSQTSNFPPSRNVSMKYRRIKFLPQSWFSYSIICERLTRSIKRTVFTLYISCAQLSSTNITQICVLSI